MNTTLADRIVKTNKAMRIGLHALLSHMDELSDLIACFPLEPSAARPLSITEPASPLALIRATFTVRTTLRAVVLQLGAP